MATITELDALYKICIDNLYEDEELVIVKVSVLREIVEKLDKAFGEYERGYDDGFTDAGGYEQKD